MKTHFKTGDKIRNKTDHSYKGTVTRTKHVPKRGLTYGDFQWIWLDGSNTPCGSTSDDWELDL